MNKPERGITILMAEDDPDDAVLARDAARAAHLAENLVIVEDGRQLLDYLHHAGDWQDSTHTLPDLILLDLNMPGMDGREALVHLRQDPELADIPVVVLTTSRQEEEVLQAYDLGVAGYVVKPSSFEGLVDIMMNLGSYWLEA